MLVIHGKRLALLLMLLVGTDDAALAGADAQAVRREFPVERYGARGDGQADDTAAIQAALDAAHAAGGGMVRLRAATYRIFPQSGGVFSVGSNVEIRGEGPRSILKIGDQAGDYNFIFGQWSAEAKRNYHHVENVTFRNFRVDQNLAGNRAVDIQEGKGCQNVCQFFDFTNLTIQGVHFDPEPGIQALVFAGPKAEGVTIADCVFRFVRGPSRRTPQRTYYDHSSVYTEARQVRIRQNVFEAALEQHAITAIEVHGGPHVTVADNRIDGFAIGINVVNATREYPDVRDGDFLIQNNRIERTTQGIALWSNRGRTLRDVRVEKNEIGMARHEHYPDVWLGIYLYYLPGDHSTEGNFEKITLSGNRIDFTGLPAGAHTAIGIDLAPAAHAREVVVRGNTIRSAPVTGIRLGNAKTENVLEAIVVENNTIIDAGWERKADASARAALVLDRATLRDVHVRKNRIEDTGPAGRPHGSRAVWAHPGPGSRQVRVQQNDIVSPNALGYDVDRQRVQLSTQAPSP